MEAQLALLAAARPTSPLFSRPSPPPGHVALPLVSNIYRCFSFLFGDMYIYLGVLHVLNCSFSPNLRIVHVVFIVSDVVILQLLGPRVPRDRVLDAPLDDITLEEQVYGLEGHVLGLGYAEDDIDPHNDTTGPE
jgi:hypothetical protein